MGAFVDQLAPFVSADWLRPRLEDVVVVDARWALDGSQDREGYLERHLPGAVYVDVSRVCSGPTGRGRAPLPDPQTFAADLGQAGIGDDSVVIAYDQGGAAGAARLVWMLRSIGVTAAVLDGGYTTWPGPFASGEVQPATASRTPVPWPSSAFLDADELSGLLAGDAHSFVVDARGAERFTGHSEPRDPRAGHIPGAVNVPITAHVDGPRLRNQDELRAVYERAGAFDADHVVAYCGSGMAACENLLVLESLGIEGRLYTGSWSDWSTDPQLPAATGEAAGRWPES